MSEYRMILPEEIFSNREIHSYIECGNNCLGAIGFTVSYWPPFFYDRFRSDF